MFHRLRLAKREVISPELVQRKREAEQTQELAKRELEEAREIAKTMREIRAKNHFAEGFKKALGGTGGH